MADALGSLMQRMVVAKLKLDAAINNRCALECLVLQSNILDGTLRVGLVLKAQLDARTSTIDESLLTQSGPVSITTQQAIYQQCLDAKIIDQSVFSKLMQAADKRNAYLHSYVLSNVDYDLAARLVFEVDDLTEAVRTAIDKLEKQQVATGVGITAVGAIGSTEELLGGAGAKKPH